MWPLNLCGCCAISDVEKEVACNHALLAAAAAAGLMDLPDVSFGLPYDPELYPKQHTPMLFMLLLLLLQVGWICQTIVIFGLPYDPELYFNPNNVAKVFFWIFACLPWCPLSKAVLDLAAATNAERDPGALLARLLQHVRH
jgi:hypothetical protein